MKKTVRLVDINGETIYLPKGYKEAIDAINDMLVGMEKENVDRSDMAAILENLYGEGRFTLRFLPRREDEE